MSLYPSSSSAPEFPRLATVATVPTASLRTALMSEPPDSGIAHTPCTPSVNRFGSFQRQAAFAAPKSRIDRLILYEQVHRFVDDEVMPGEEEPRWMNASGLTLWIAIVVGARHPLACVGFKMQSRDDTDAAFLSVAVGAPAPSFF